MTSTHCGSEMPRILAVTTVVLSRPLLFPGSTAAVVIGRAKLEKLGFWNLIKPSCFFLHRLSTLGVAKCYLNAFSYGAPSFVGYDSKELLPLMLMAVP